MSHSRGYVQVTGTGVGVMFMSLESKSGLCSGHWSRSRAIFWSLESESGYVLVTGVGVGVGTMFWSLESESGLRSEHWSRNQLLKNINSWV